MNTKYKKLLLSLILDGIGFFTIGVVDFAWAPISGIIMSKMYKGKQGKIAGFISFIEELIPFADVVPTFTIVWFYTYIIKKDSKNEVTNQ